MKKRPFLLATLTVGGIFLFFLLVVFTAGYFHSGSMAVSVGDKIGVLEVEGPIDDAKRLIGQIRDFRERGSIKAVVLRINSPGGGVGPSQEIYAELKKLAAEKPLIVSMGSVAASGGYYLAIAGERIFANPGTITGSIGVIMSFPNYQELMGKVGVATETIKSGQYKDVGSATKPFTDADRHLLQNLIDDVYQQFIEAVSKGRNIPVDRLQPYADGRILSGRQAKEIGLVDELGTFYDAIDYAADLIGLGADPDLVYPEPIEKNLLDRYLDTMMSRYLGVDMFPVKMHGPLYLWSGY